MLPSAPVLSCDKVPPRKQGLQEVLVVGRAALEPATSGEKMGDYIASVSVGKDQYSAGATTRDTVTTFLWPQGRHDPNVHFARR
jgi:hypothetical protein